MRDQRKVRMWAMEDRLSSLPDEIITLILSFLATKYAVRTTVLGRQWKGLWTRVSNLDFDFGNWGLNHMMNENITEIRELRFSRFVNKVLSKHKSLDSLRRFRLHFRPSWYEREVPQDFWHWRILVFGSQIEEIDMMFDGVWLPEVSRQLPESFYTLKNLKVVKLEGLKMIACDSISLPGVKILQFRRVEIKDVESLSKLISDCPVLETLLLDDCSFINRNQKVRHEKVMLMASLPSLRNLSIVDYYNYLYPIAIEAPNLEHLVLVRFLQLHFIGNSPSPCLRSARVSMGDFSSSRDNCLIIRLLTQISSTKEICLNQPILVRFSDITGVQLPIFPNLTHLTIELTAIGTQILHFLLPSVPKLQSLVIEPMFDALPNIPERTEPTCKPQCLLSSLEEIKFNGFAPFKSDIRMVKYLLNVGVVLKKVDIHILDDDTTERKCKKLASLLKLANKSSACDVRVLLRDDEIDFNIDDDEINIYNEDEFDLDDEDEYDEDEGEDKYDDEDEDGDDDEDEDEDEDEY